MKQNNFLACMGVCHVFNFCCRNNYNKLSFTHPTDCSREHLKHISTCRTSSIKISRPVGVEKSIYIYLCFSFSFSLVIDCIFCRATQVPEHSFDNSLVLFPRCQHVHENICSSSNHCIYKTTNRTSIGNKWHVLYLFPFLWTLSNN
jgi:hypothetical protein